MTVRMKTDIHFRPIEHSAVILNERTGQYWQLNETAAYILQAVLTDTTKAEIADQIITARPVNRERALADIHSLLDELTRADLIEQT